MKKIFLVLIIFQLAINVQAQQRDRLADLKIKCGYQIDLSPTGKLWMSDRCGHIWVADSIGATWRTVLSPINEDFTAGTTFERVATFGSDIAVAAGYLQPGKFVLRTADGGHHWDTLQVDPNLVWVHGFCYHSDGKLWITSASGRNFQSMSYSENEGRTFVRLVPSFVSKKDGTDGIEELYMASADSGFAGTYGNGLYFTSDNWRTVRRLTTPMDQHLLQKRNYQDTWINRIRFWKNWLIVTESDTTAYTDFSIELQWKPLPLPITTYEVDTTLDMLWTITKDGKLVLMEDMENWKTVKEGFSDQTFICGTIGGCAYLSTPDGVVRVASNGHADTCGFFTDEKTLEDVFDDIFARNAEYGISAQSALPTLNHGNRRWRTDGSSIYLEDSEGWYRIAKPLNIGKILPDLDRSDRIIFLCYDEKNYSVDTNGRVEHYSYHNPTADFVQSGLGSVEIATYYGGCFNYDDHTVRYTRQGNLLYETENTVEKDTHVIRSFPADSLERALLHLGKQYGVFPTPKDFGLQEGQVDLKNVFQNLGWCTSYAGYKVVFINQAGETLTAYGRSDVDCGEYFPWLLPMQIQSDKVAFTTYQPILWKALRPMMPDKMMLRKHLNSLSFLRPGDLLFFRDTEGMGAAVAESTGQYTHVAIVESVGDTVWIIDATPQYGVARRPYLNSDNDGLPFPDIYRIESVNLNMEHVLRRARSLVGKPYDDAFLPDNDAYYCSELVYECFLDEYGETDDIHLFELKPMNWRDADGKLPEYWVNHFKKLGLSVPEGVPGTNPTDMSRSPLLKRLQ